MTAASPPLVVLADDLSGAVEIAGVATRYGLTAQVRTEPVVESAADVLCLDMHTRNGTAENAARVADKWAKSLVSAGIARVFQKTDSLLRGHVARETEAILAAIGRQTCVLCPANPSRGRTILGGRYFIGGVPLDQTVFAHDPVHPRQSAVARELLGNSKATIETPDIASPSDLQKIAASLDTAALPAGGADFFAAILQAAAQRPIPLQSIELQSPRLIVCGSLAAWQSDRPQQAAAHGVPVVTLDGTNPAKSTAVHLATRGIGLLAIGPQSDSNPQTLERQLAEQVAQVLDHAAPPAWLLLEGSATARAVIDRCGWKSFRALGELAPGIVAIAADDSGAPKLVIKPGSYAWPEVVWR